jgi:hypothetical protein
MRAKKRDDWDDGGRRGMRGKDSDEGKEWDDGERRVMKWKGIGYIWEYVYRENKSSSYLRVKFYFCCIGHLCRVAKNTAKSTDCVFLMPKPKSIQI